MSSVYFSFQDINSLKQTFEKRIGLPDECTSALGHVVIGFSWLEESLSDHIATLAQLSGHIAPAVTAELSFKTKVSVLSSLVRPKLSLRCFNVGSDEPEDVWNDIVKMLFASEELRNKLLHSHWSLALGEVIFRRKTTVKASHGVRVAEEEHSAAYLLDAYDFILNVKMVLDEFFIVTPPSDSPVAL